MSKNSKYKVVVFYSIPMQEEIEVEAESFHAARVNAIIEMQQRGGQMDDIHTGPDACARIEADGLHLEVPGDNVLFYDYDVVE